MPRAWIGLLCFAFACVSLFSVPLFAQECFPEGPVPGFPQWKIGPEIQGASRLNDDLIEICSSSAGYGGTLDSLLSLAVDSPPEFEMTVEVVSIDGIGEAGLEARAFSGTGTDPQQTVFWVAVRKNDDGGVVLLEEGALLLLRVPLSLSIRVADEHGWWHGGVSCPAAGRSEAALSTQAPVWTVVDSCRASDRSPRAACAVASTRYAQRLLDEL